MEQIKIIFFDIDGTLIDPATKKISARTHAVLKWLREKGILLCIATGRSPAAFPDFGDAHFDAFCAFNGSLCFTEDTIIHSNPIPQESIKQVLKNATSIGRPISVATRDGLAANGWDKDLADYYALAKLELTPAEDFDTFCHKDVYQIMLGCRDSDHKDILEGTEGVKIAVSWDRAVDVIPASSGKGASIKEVLEFFHLKPAQALAFGDSYNDVEMLQAVGTGVAMGNAPDALKAIADDVCKSVSEDGIYDYCKTHNLL